LATLDDVLRQLFKQTSERVESNFQRDRSESVRRDPCGLLSSSAAASAVALPAVGSHHLLMRLIFLDRARHWKPTCDSPLPSKANILAAGEWQTERIDQRWTSVFIEQITANTKVDLP
jgi:hypothetical protein